MTTTALTIVNNNTTAMTTTKNNVPIVRTEHEFENALKAKCPHFIFEGPKAMEICQRLQQAERKKKNARTAGVGLSLLFLCAAPFTGGASLLGLGATMGAVALSEPVILAIITGVVTVATAIVGAIKDYQIKKLERGVELIRK